MSKRPKKIKLTPGQPPKKARRASAVSAKEHRPEPHPSDVVVDSAPVLTPGGDGIGALPRSKRKTPAHVKAALARAEARSAGKEAPPSPTTGVDPALIAAVAAKEREEARAAGEPVPPAPEEERIAPVYAIKSKGGRPSSYKPEFCEVARKYCEAGATDYELADIFDVNVSTIKNWRLEHSEFLTACAIGKLNADNEIERSLFQNAKGYHRKTEKVMQFQGAPFRVEVIEHVPGDVGAQKHWLANRRPNEWRVSPEDKSAAISEAAAMTVIEMARAVAFMLGQGMQAHTVTTIDAQPND